MTLILIVDDRESDRSELAAIAEAGGHDVAEAASGQEALQALNEISPAAIVLDVEMDGIDGLAVLEKIRQTPATAKLPIIMVSDSISDAIKVRAQQFDVIDVLPKPINADALLLRLTWAMKSGSLIPALGWENADAEAAKGKGIGDGMSLKKILNASSATAAADYHGREGEYVTEVTPELGGQLETPSGQHSVEIPRGAVPDKVGLHMKPVEDATPPDVGTMRVRLGDRTVDVRLSDKTGAGITGMELGQPARIAIMPGDELADLPGEKTLQEYLPATGEWIDLPTVIDPETGEAFTEKSRMGAVGRRRARVLIVEPEPKEAEKIRVALEGLGCRVSFEEVEGQVSRSIIRDRPSIVILGIGASGPLGARLMRRIKSDIKTEYVTLIAISHPKDKNGYADALTLGVRDVIKGPVQMGELQYRVSRAYRSILEKRKLAARRAEALERQVLALQLPARRPTARPKPAATPQANGGPPSGERAALRRAAQEALQKRSAIPGNPKTAGPVRRVKPAAGLDNPRRQKPETTAIASGQDRKQRIPQAHAESQPRRRNSDS